MRRPLLRTVAATATLVAALALAACGGDEPAEETSTATSSQSPSGSPSESPADEPSASPSEKPSKESSPEPEPEPEGPSVDITVEGDSVSPNAEVVEGEIGQPVTLRITSDRAGELHVHASPEQYVDFGPGTTTEQVTVDKPGAIDIEEHESGALVVKLLVQ